MARPIKAKRVSLYVSLVDSLPTSKTIPVVVSPNAGAVAVRAGVQYVQTTMPVQVRRV